MTAIFCPPPLQQNRSHLQAFLASCQHRSRGRRRPLIASFSLPLGTVDPLAALQTVATPHSRYFYWEHPAQAAAEAALDVALELAPPQRYGKGSGSRDRFARAREFVERAMARLQCDPVSGAAARVRFYHCFSFFETSAHFPSASIVLPRWQISRRQGRSWLTVNLPIGPKDNLEVLWATVMARLDAIAAVPASPASPLNPPQFSGEFTPFTTAVAAALQAIEARSLEKVVLAHSLEVRASEPFAPVRALAYLRQYHPHCYTFAVSTGYGQTFVGASPERLVALRAGRATCDALAGSVRRGRTAAEDARLARQLLANHKERREHQAVKGFLCDRLKQLGLQPQATEPRLLQLANIQHLWTPIRAAVPGGLHLLDLVAWLHPTPAVAGLPAKTACRCIRRWEPFDRGPYAAPVGWLDTQGNGEFVVGIRSALLDGARAQLYAGAGIVAGSTPERERAEVELKLQAMLKALG